MTVQPHSSKRSPYAWLRQHLSPLIALGLFVLALGIGLHAASLAPAQDFEAPRVSLSERLEAVVLAVSERGPSALLTPETQASCSSVPTESVLLNLLSAWSKLSLGRVGLLSELASLRVPGVAFAALAPTLLFLLVRFGFELRVALWAALALLATPAWRAASAVASPGAIATSAWLLILVPYVASLARDRESRRKRLCFAGLTTLASGIGLSLSWSVFWVLPFMALHYLVVQRTSLRALAARGLLPAPAAFVFSVGVTPVLLVLLNPALWGASATAIARLWLTPMRAPEIIHRDVSVFIVTSSVLFLFLVGAAGCPLMLFDRLRRRFADVQIAAEFVNVSALIVLGLGCALLGPLVVPSILAGSHSSFELTLPFLAAATAFIVVSAARRPQNGRFAPAIEAAALAVLLVVR